MSPRRIHYILIDYLKKAKKREPAQRVGASPVRLTFFTCYIPKCMLFLYVHLSFSLQLTRLENVVTSLLIFFQLERYLAVGFLANLIFLSRLIRLGSESLFVQFHFFFFKKLRK